MKWWDQRPWSWSGFVFIISFGLGALLFVWVSSCFLLSLFFSFVVVIFFIGLFFGYLDLFLLLVEGYICLLSFFLHLSQFCYYLPWALFVWFFPFLPCHMACGVMVPRLWVRSSCDGSFKFRLLDHQRSPENTSWHELCQRSAFSTKTQLYPTAHKQQRWMPQAKQSARGTQPYSSTEMRQQRNMLQMKEQGKHLQNQVNEEEIESTWKRIQRNNSKITKNLGNKMEAWTAWMGGGFGENSYIYMYGRVPSLFTWNYHNVVNQLYHKTKWFWC